MQRYPKRQAAKVSTFGRRAPCRAGSASILTSQFPTDNNLRRDLDDALGDSIVDEFGDVLPLGSQEMAQFEQYDRPTSPVDSPVKDEDPAQQASAGPTAAFGVADTDALIRTLSAAGGGFMTGRNAPIKMAPTDRLAKQANALLVPPQPIFNALETEKSTSAKGSRLPMPSAEAMQLARKRLFADLDDDLPSEPGAYGFGTNGDGAAATASARNSHDRWNGARWHGRPVSKRAQSFAIRDGRAQDHHHTSSAGYQGESGFI
ncbi:MAG: hypothetical protein BJ554DRAFT_2352 [Olpidium bornovanus]|uniref:Uncharacterized protein n=1 Tax=Olpidium bornovanus TaxID=278681 RepID=A0A8H7ZR01_9FUNG|nr:MAG: hypothetical protein BJ554DRAFT_2352 [Olpidium bornovanus]